MGFLLVAVSAALIIVAGVVVLGWDLLRRWIQYRVLMAQLGVPEDWREYEYRLHVLDARVRELAQRQSLSDSRMDGRDSFG